MIIGEYMGFEGINSTLLGVTPTHDPRWLIIEQGFNLAREHEVESLLAISNGYIGTRGSLAEGSSLSSPATYLAGVYAIPRPGGVPELALAPDWLHIQATLNGQPLRIEGGPAGDHYRVLDLRQGILWRDWRFADAEDRISRILGLRLASLADRHLLVQSMRFLPVNYTGELAIDAHIEPLAARPTEAVMTDLPPHTERNPGEAGVNIMEMQTQSGITIAFAVATRVRILPGNGDSQADDTQSYVGLESWATRVEMGKAYQLDRVVSVFTSRDGERPAEMAKQHLLGVLQEGLTGAVRAHVEAWADQWRQADIQVAGDDAAQRALRFACYHLISAANPADERVSVGARTLTGNAYKGHVFWDTEIFMLPFYTLTDPQAARALLMYRYHTLPAALEKARSLGYRGALYAWESTDTGRETTPPFIIAPDGEVIRILSGVEEHHISADVAYAIWQYWQATGDNDFLLQAGAEIILQTARFWASRGKFEDDGLYHICKVVGPDEYHEDVDDNAFTNGMAKWNLEQAGRLADLLAKRWPSRWKNLVARLGLTSEEFSDWQRIAAHMYLGMDPKTGLIEQFRGFFALEDIDLSQYAHRNVPLDMLLGREVVHKSKIIKQADVVMLIYLLWDQFTPEQRRVNFEYYETRTSHGSSLSPSIYALVAARLGNVDHALQYFRQAAEIDLSNNMGNAAGGVHAAAMGGLWQAAIFGFAGMELHGDALAFYPHCPPEWQTMDFSVRLRGLNLKGHMTPDTFRVDVQGGSPLMVTVGDRPAQPVPPGQPASWKLAS